MTTVAHQHPQPGRAESHRAPSPRAAVRWLVSRAALHAARPDLAGPDGGPVTVEIGSGPAGVWARACDGPQSRAIEVAAAGPAAWASDRESGLIHLEVPGILRATIAAASGERPAAALYAHTPLFAAWGLAGGRYEVCGADLGD